MALVFAGCHGVDWLIAIDCYFLNSVSSQGLNLCLGYVNRSIEENIETARTKRPSKHSLAASLCLLPLSIVSGKIKFHELFLPLAHYDPTQAYFPVFRRFCQTFPVETLEICQLPIG